MLTEAEKTAFLNSLKLFIFLLLFSLLLLFASAYVGGAAYIFAMINSCWFLAAASQAPGFSRHATLPPVIKDWKFLTFTIFILYTAVILLSGFGSLYVPVTYCCLVLAFLLGLNFWVLGKF